MNVRLHASLNEFINYYRMVAPIFTCVAFASFKVAILLCLPALVPALLTWLIPIACSSMSCTGRMRATTERLSFWKSSLLYKCDNCGSLHREEIFDPNFQISVEYS